jgi:hypothetical protein
MTRISIFALLAAGLLATGSPAWANCGGHCMQMKACASQVREKGTPKAQFQAEYNKCMADPHNYK